MEGHQPDTSLRHERGFRSFLPLSSPVPSAQLLTTLRGRISFANLTHLGTQRDNDLAFAGGHAMAHDNSSIKFVMRFGEALEKGR